MLYFVEAGLYLKYFAGAQLLGFIDRWEKMLNDLKLLDCTLRDGGYINDWKWGFHKARAIIRYLSKAKVDYVEVGFLRNVDTYDRDVTVCNTIEELN